MGSLTHTIKLRADLARAQYNLGLVCQLAGKNQEAAQAFQEFLRLTPKTPENRGEIAEAKAKHKKLSG